MSITKKIFPDKIMPAYNNVVSVVQSDNITEEDFVHIYDVKDSSGTRISRVKMPANLDGYGVFDAHRILETQVGSDIYPQLTGFTTTTNNFFQYDIEFGEQFKFVWDFYDNTIISGAAGFTGSTRHYFEVGDIVLVTQNPTGATNPQYDGVHTVTEVPDIYSLAIDVSWGVSTGAEAGTIVYSDFRATQFTGLTSTTGNFVFNGAISNEDFRTYDFTDYILDRNNPGRFLTNVPNNWKFDLDTHAYAFIHQTGGTNPYYIRYDLSNGNTYRIANGNPDSKQLAVGIGTWNINNSTLGNIIDSSITSYSAYTEDSSSGRTSEVLTFKVYDKCAGSPYTQTQVVFMDRLGSMIGFNFDLATSQNTSIKREEYKKISGSYNASTNTWGYNSYDRGRTIHNVQENTSYTVTSDWITETNAAYLKEMFTSPEAYVVDANGNWLAIIIENTSFQTKYRNVEKLINYEMTFSYANRDDIQRG